MKINRKYLQTFAFILVYLYAIYFWSQPLQERKLPYGEYDAMSHFEVADYMAYNDKSFMNLPHYIDLRYGRDNKFKPHTLWYPPTFHSSLAVAESVGGERIVPVFLMNTILATFIIVTVYFVINSLFGFLPAILSAILLVFSPRDFMPYLWGQWPERFAYAFIPIILYCFYKYLLSFQEGHKKPVYLYFAGVFLGINILIHPLVFFHSIIALSVLYIFMAIKHRKIFFNLKHISIAALIFIVLFMMFPYQTFDIFSDFGQSNGDNAAQKKLFEWSRLFRWSLNPKDYEGSVPANYFSFREMHGLWTLPFLLIGIFILIWRREDKDILLLTWLVSLYIALHRDLFGVTTFLHRSLSATAHIFAPLTAIGIAYIASFVKLPPNIRAYIKYGLVAVFAYFVITVNFAYAAQYLSKNIYNPNLVVDGRLTRNYLKILTEPQLRAGQWVLDNVPEQYNVSVLGIPHKDEFLSDTAYKIRWLAAVSQHVNRFYFLYPQNETESHLKNDYILIDYSMVGVIQDKELFDMLKTFEETKIGNAAPLYNKDNIKVYKLETN